MRARPMIVVALVSLFFHSGAHSAGRFFEDCQQALKTRPFAKLQAFLSKHADEAPPDRCFRLDDNRFLVTVRDVGRRVEGLYMYDATNGSYDFADGAFRPGIDVLEEFVDGRGKRYAILRSVDAHEGVSSDDVSLLYLVPHSQGTFKIQTLVETSEDPVSGLCGDDHSKRVATSIKALHVLEEGEDTILIFRLQEQNCTTMSQRQIERGFRATRDGVVPVQVAQLGAPRDGAKAGKQLWPRP